MADDHAAHAIGAYGSAIDEKYLRCVAALDENVARLLDFLDDRGLADDTVVVYGARDEPRPEEWELFDLQADPFELRSLHDDPAHAGVLADLRAELDRLSDEAGDTRPDRDPRRHRETSA